MEPDLRAQFKSQCALQQTSMNEVVTMLIEQWLQERREAKQPSPRATIDGGEIPTQSEAK